MVFMYFFHNLLAGLLVLFFVQEHFISSLSGLINSFKVFSLFFRRISHKALPKVLYSSGKPSSFSSKLIVVGGCFGSTFDVSVLIGSMSSFFIFLVFNRVVLFFFTV